MLMNCMHCCFSCIVSISLSSYDSFVVLSASLSIVLHCRCAASYIADEHAIGMHVGHSIGQLFRDNRMRSYEIVFMSLETRNGKTGKW